MYALPADLADGKGKRSFDGLLYGADTRPVAKGIAFEPAHLKNAGYVVVRHRLASGGLRSIFTNYGSPHHRSHIDRLSVHVSEDGNDLVGMMGQMSKYGRKGWYSTIADSLLAVNGRDQIIGRGRLVRLEQTRDWAAVEVATDPATPLYEPDVVYHRLVVSAPDFLVLLDRAVAAEPVAFQWAFYPGMDMSVPEGWQPAAHPGLDPGRKQTGPLSPVRKDWLAGPSPVTELGLLAEVRDEKPVMPVRVLASPAQRPMAFSTPGHQKGGWIRALLLHGTKQQGAAWAAVLDRSGKRAVRAAWLPVHGADGKPLPLAEARPCRSTPPAADGSWP